MRWIEQLFMWVFGFVESEKFVSIKWLKHDDAIIETNKARYRGGGTVWHAADTGRRQGTFTEGWLADVWTAQRWARDDAISDSRMSQIEEGRA